MDVTVRNQKPVNVSVDGMSPVGISGSQTPINLQITRVRGGGITIQQGIQGPPGPEGPTGPEGPPGPSGGGGGSVLVFTQTTAATVWTIVHNLGRAPLGLQVFDSSGAERELATIQNVDADTTTVTFLTPTSGEVVYS